MKIHTRVIHRLVRFCRLEYACMVLGRYVPAFIKAIPLPEEYPAGKFLKIKRDGTVFNVDRSDYMQWHIYSGLPDVSWKKAASVLSDGCTVLDIGANCGQFSLKLANSLFRNGFQHFTIHAFEPNPIVFSLLEANHHLNPDLGVHVACHAIALGKEEGEMPFAYNPSNSGGGSLLLKSEGEQHVKLVKIERLEEVVQALSLSKIDFIKIDVEGFEPEVLQGAAKVIEKFRPWLYIEITPSWFESRGHQTQALISGLSDSGYELEGEYKERFLPYLENEQLFRSLHQFNLLAKPPMHGG